MYEFKRRSTLETARPCDRLRRGSAVHRSLFLLLGLIAAALVFAGPASAAEEEEPPTNLSFPAIWSDGAMLLAPLEGAPTFTGAFTTIGTTDWYHQKDAGNTWQAQTLNAATAGVEGVEVSTVDWGDNLEAKSWEAGQQVRVETVLYENLTNPKISAALEGETTMSAYTMEQTNPPVKGPEEMWGTNKITFPSPEATVYSACARMTIQRLRISRSDPAVSLLKWDPASAAWTGSELIAPPLFKGGVWEGGEGTGGYSAEVNIKGVTVYGYNWKTTGLEQGDYRLTFSLDPNCPAATLNTFITNETAVAVSEEETASLGAVTAAEMEGGEGHVDGAGNLTYIDVRLGNPTYAPYVPPVPAQPTGTTSGTPNQEQHRKRMRITLRTQTREVHAGDMVVLTGTASPARNGALVRLQRRVRSRSGQVTYLNVKSVRLRKHTQSQSRFKFRIRVRKGTTFRALVPGNADYLQSTSTPLRIELHK